MSYGNDGRYGGPPNPYAQGGQSQGYGVPSPKYGGYNSVPTMGRDDYGGQNVEMASLTQNGSQFGQQSSDPTAILNACRDIEYQIETAYKNIELLKRFRRRAADDVDQSWIGPELDKVSSNFMNDFRAITGEMGRIKRLPESGSSMNAGQIKRIQSKIETLMQEYKAKEQEFQNAVRDQMRSQYSIVHPEATRQEIETAVPNAEQQQIFSQELMQSNRRGQANTTLQAVRQRNQAIKKIESDIVLIAELFQDMENMVVEQEAAVVNIEQKGEEVVDNMDKGNQELVTGIASARARNRKKWWCLGICVAIIAVIVIVILIYKFVIQKPVKKRWLMDEQLVRRVVQAGVDWNEERAAVPGLAYAGGSKKMRQFVA